jgi:uncharacterized membrane protein HdeD (DUF308 family)
MKAIKITYGIGIFIIACGISLMLTSMGFRNQPDIKQAYINIGLLIGVIGIIINITANGFERNIKPKKPNDDIKRGN